MARKTKLKTEIRKERKRKEPTLPQLKQRLQQVFNKFIRLRDYGKPCISCGRKRLLQAGHFYSVKGYDGLRYDEYHVHGECGGCNGFDDMHLLGYSENLKERIGIEEYEALKQRAADYKREGYKFLKSDIIEMIEIYKRKVKILEQKGSNNFAE